MKIFFIVMLLINLIIGIFLFKQLYRKRKMFQDRFGMIITATETGSLSLSISLITYFLFPAGISVVSLAAIVSGGLIGVSFGSLIKFQSLLAGFSHGVMGGLMGTMMGAVIKDPSICSLPMAYLYKIDHNMILFSLFSTFIVISTSFLVHYSLRV